MRTFSLRWLYRVFVNFWQKIFVFGISLQNDMTKKLCITLKNDVYIQQTKSKNIQHIKTIAEVPRARHLIPVIGPLYDLMAAGGAEKLHLYIHKRHQQLGPIFCENLGGGSNVVFVASSNLMRSVFLYEGQYPRHPLPEAWILYNKTHNCQRGVFFMEGEEWLYHRRILNRVFLQGNLNWMKEPIQYCTQILMNKWIALASNAFVPVEISQLEEHLFRWSVNVICSIMFGNINNTSERLEEALDRFSKNMRKIFDKSASLMNFPPRLAQLLKMNVWTSFEHTVTDVLTLGGEIIDLFIEKISDNVLDSKTLYGMLCEAEIPLDMIKRIFVDLVIAAGDTTTFTSEWTLYLLSNDAQLQNQILNEVKTSGLERSLTQGLIKESMRLYPVAPFIGRYIAKDALIDNYTIKKGTMVILSLYTAGRDVLHFPDPLIAKPSRWLRNNENGKLMGVYEPHGTLPFAIGYRSCIGRKLAIYQLSSLIEQMVDNFELSCLNIKNIECILRMVSVPKEPIRLVIKLR